MSTLSYVFRSEAAQQVREEGRQRQQAENILRVLQYRKLTVPEHVRSHILDCTDWNTLTTWWEQAFHVTEATELRSDSATLDSNSP